MPSWPGLDLGDGRLGPHFAILGALCAIIGFQALLFGVFTKAYARIKKPGYTDGTLAALDRHFTLERGLIAGGFYFVAGLVIDIWILSDWLSTHGGPLDAIRPALLALTLMTMGAMTAFASFFLSLFLDPSKKAPTHV